MRKLVLAFALVLTVVALAPAQASALCYGPDAAMVGDYAVQEWYYVTETSPGDPAARWDAYTAGLNAINYYVLTNCISPLTPWMMQLYMDWYNFYVSGYEPEGNYYVLREWVLNNLSGGAT